MSIHAEISGGVSTHHDLCFSFLCLQIYDDRVRALIEEKGYTRLEANDEIESLSLARFDGRAVFELDMEMRPGVIATYATARAMMEDPVAFESRYVELAFQLGPQLSTEMLILLHRE